MITKKLIVEFLFMHNAESEMPAVLSSPRQIQMQQCFVCFIIARQISSSCGFILALGKREGSFRCTS